MKIDAVVFQLAVVFLPGILWHAIADKLTVHQPRTTLGSVSRAFAFGLATYVIYFAFYGLLNGSLKGVEDPLTMESIQRVTALDIAVASLIGVLLGVVWSYAVNHKWFMRAMQRMKVSRRYGDEDVWDYTLNMGTPQVEYVNVRDLPNGLTYSGWVKAFSEASGLRELLLENVRVFHTETGETQLETPLLYVARPTDGMHIEFPYGTVGTTVEGTGEGDTHHENESEHREEVN